MYLHDFKTAFRVNIVIPHILSYLEEKQGNIFKQHTQWHAS